MEDLPVHTRIIEENREGGLLLCGINHGYSKHDERQDATGIDRSDSHKSFFSDSEVNDYPFRNKIVSWFDLWGYELARSKRLAGRFERSIIQTNWLQTCSNNVRGVNTQRACIEEHKSFLETCSALKPGIIFFFGQEPLWAFTSPALSPKVETIFGARTGEIQWLQKTIYYNGKRCTRFRFGFQQYERLAVVALPHPTGARGIASDYIAAFKPEMSKIIDVWWAKHEETLTRRSRATG
ncbi:hypothetical protein GPM19_00640 [Halomonas sp. ZH2S]|uniref:Uracil-DNA glycosylase-like domain-containing protein n=1 Tax=Vreelandella zhuhanensis TaxID=2684210 RepID=A0A7X3GXI4_9GAMM|nr:hypothetical protein [Halomonas zhuhanensis]MWJ26726.1 hypothetical protein [Halomonas zhuhanensis]